MSAADCNDDQLCPHKLAIQRSEANADDGMAATATAAADDARPGKRLLTGMGCFRRRFRPPRLFFLRPTARLFESTNISTLARRVRLRAMAPRSCPTIRPRIGVNYRFSGPTAVVAGADCRRSDRDFGLKIVSGGRSKWPPDCIGRLKVPFSHLDKDSQGRIDDLCAPDPIGANMSPQCHDHP